MLHTFQFFFTYLQQRCEGSSSGSEHGSTAAAIDMPSSQMKNDKVTGDRDKIPNAVAAALPNKLFMAPGMSSTPKNDVQGEMICSVFVTIVTTCT